MMINPAFYPRKKAKTIKGLAPARPPVRGNLDLVLIEEMIVEELSNRRQTLLSGRPSEDRFSPNGWLKVTCYELILTSLSEDDGTHLFGRLDVHNRFKRGTRKADRDIFQKGIVAIFAKNPTVVSVRDRERIAAPMWYAFRHYIPPAMLDGFNLQYPAHCSKLPGWRDQMEKALDQWVREQRFFSRVRECRLDRFRGSYPKWTESNVKRRVRLLEELVDSPEPLDYLCDNAIVDMLLSGRGSYR